MCGIVGYIGKRNARPIIMDGLKRLEYRGYDSAGISIIEDDTREIITIKKKGKVSELESVLDLDKFNGSIGIGHTRRATHGEPNDVNAHPHFDMDNKIVIIHNGIIENYKTIKTKLERDGYTFRSETDTEVLANLINYNYKQKGDFEIAVR